MVYLFNVKLYGCYIQVTTANQTFVVGCVYSTDYINLIQFMIQNTFIICNLDNNVSNLRMYHH